MKHKRITVDLPDEETFEKQIEAVTDHYRENVSGLAGAAIFGHYVYQALSDALVNLQKKHDDILDKSRRRREALSGLQKVVESRNESIRELEANLQQSAAYGQTMTRRAELEHNEAKQWKASAYQLSDDLREARNTIMRMEADQPSTFGVLPAGDWNHARIEGRDGTVWIDGKQVGQLHEWYVDSDSGQATGMVNAGSWDETRAELEAANNRAEAWEQIALANGEAGREFMDEARELRRQLDVVTKHRRQLQELLDSTVDAAEGWYQQNAKRGKEVRELQEDVAVVSKDLAAMYQTAHRLHDAIQTHRDSWKREVYVDDSSVANPWDYDLWQYLADSPTKPAEAPGQYVDVLEDGNVVGSIPVSDRAGISVRTRFVAKEAGQYHVEDPKPASPKYETIISRGDEACNCRSGACEA